MSEVNPEAVRTRKDLARFVRGLAAELKQQPEEWQNVDLGQFLEALSAWIDDMDGYYRNKGEAVPKEPQWKTLAEILSAARVYE